MMRLRLPIWWTAPLASRLSDQRPSFLLRGNGSAKKERPLELCWVDANPSSW